MEKEKKEIELSTFEMIIQVIALLLLISLFVVDKIMHLVEPPVESYYYGFLLAVGFGLKKEIINFFEHKFFNKNK